MEIFQIIRLGIENTFDTLNVWVQDINNVLWGWPMLTILLGTHLYLTFRLRFPQKYLFKAIKLSVTKDKGSDGEVSQFAALATSLAGAIGTGNIVGVATAILIGGPGAVLWCWLTGFLGMATKYSEGLLAIKYRVKRRNGKIAGGPMYVLQRGLNKPLLATIFCIFTLIMSFSGGNFIQGNAISETLKNSYNIDMYLTATVLTCLVGAVIFFGLKGIASVCEKLVPLMALVYAVSCIVLIFINFEYLGEAIILIFKSAFEPQAIGGGAVGGLMISLQYGVSRGLLSNESGLGSAPIIAAAAKTRNPVRQALVSSTSTFWDTLVVCTITGIVTVSSMIALGISSADESSGLIMQDAFRQIPTIGYHLLTVAMFTFAFSTILGWTYYGEKALEFLIGHRSRRATQIFRTCWVLSTFIGAIMPLELVWNIGSTAAVFMAIPNLFSLIMLAKLIVKETRHYLWEDRLDETSDEEIPSL